MKSLVVFNAVLVMALASCSTAKEKQKIDPSSKAADASAEAPTDQSQTEKKDTGITLVGIPKSCKPLSQSEGAKYCIECKPRLLEVQHCFDSKGIADISKSCSHDTENVSCKDDEGKDIKFDIKPNKIEQALESLPFLTIAGRAFLADKLKDKPKELAMANGALDIFEKNALDIFRGTNSDKVADAMVAEIVKHKANLTKEQIDPLRAAIIKALSELGAALKTSKVDLSNVAKSAVDILMVLPFDTIGGGSTKLDLNKLREAFAPGGNGLEGLITLLKSGNLGSLDEILKKYQPTPAATPTSSPTVQPSATPTSAPAN